MMGLILTRLLIIYRTSLFIYRKAISLKTREYFRSFTLSCFLNQLYT